MLWLIIDATIGAVGSYNIIKGIYGMYRDAKTIKKEYTKKQHEIKAYRQLQVNKPLLTDSQFIKRDSEFIELS